MTKIEEALALLGLSVGEPFKMKGYYLADDYAQYFVDNDGDVYEIIDVSDNGIWETVMADFNFNDLFVFSECISTTPQKPTQ